MSKLGILRQFQAYKCPCECEKPIRNEEKTKKSAGVCGLWQNALECLRATTGLKTERACTRLCNYVVIVLVTVIVGVASDGSFGIFNGRATLTLLIALV